MKVFDCYEKLDLTLTKGAGATLWDHDGKAYLDCYGGHAVISIGHCHPHFIERVASQLHTLPFYSNAVANPLQDDLATKLGVLSGYRDHTLFLCNSGAEAVENAVKLASFHTGRKKVVAFTGAFHGRTAMALALSDTPKITPPSVACDQVIRVPFNDAAALAAVMSEDIAAVILEGIQGVAGVIEADDDFLGEAARLCEQWGALLILDEIQSGYGRSGAFFAHQRAGITADLVTTAKGMGNGFPVAGVLVSPRITPKIGMLGTTFGGGFLACAAGLAVLEVLAKDELTAHARRIGESLEPRLAALSGIRAVRGRGLMFGIETVADAGLVQERLLKEQRVLVGISKGANTIRLLPPLTITAAQVDQLVTALDAVL